PKRKPYGPNYIGHESLALFERRPCLWLASFGIFVASSGLVTKHVQRESPRNRVCGGGFPPHTLLRGSFSPPPAPSLRRRGGRGVRQVSPAILLADVALKSHSS